MPDLTLDEFRDVSKEKQDQIFRREIRLLNCSDPRKVKHSRKSGVSARLFKHLMAYSQRLLKSS